MTGPEVVAELRARAADLDRCEPAGLPDLWRATWAWVTSPGVAPWLREAIEAPDGQGLDAILSRHQLAALGREEEAETDALLARLGPPQGSLRDAITSPFGRATYDRLLGASRLVDFGSCRRAVVVGGGPFPAAALYLREATSVPAIDVLDVHPPAVASARRWADWCGDGRIRPRLADGVTEDYAGVDVAYVVNHARPKARILERIRDTAPSRVRILLREPVGLGRLVAQRGLSRRIPGLAVLAEGETDARFLSRHVLLARASRASRG